MQARFYDGLTAEPRSVTLEVVFGVLSFQADGAERRWPLRDVRVEPLGDLTRLCAPNDGDARLLVDTGAWRAAAGGLAAAAERRGRRGERRLVIGLAVAALLVVGFVFVGVPALSGPLARATPPSLERRMGDTFDAQLSVPFRTCKFSSEGQWALYQLGRRLQKAADTPFEIRVRAVEAPFVNAFALPGGAVVVTDDLIRMARTPDELAAVIAHESAHVEQRHVMQAVWRSLGLGLVLDAVVGGGSGAGQQAVLLAGNFADLRYSRAAELEADARGMQLLEAAGLSSEGMAPFFERMAAKGEGADAAAVKELISSHPDSLRRAKISRAKAHPGATAFGGQEWAAIKAACEAPPHKP